MSNLICVEGKEIETTDAGFLVNRDDWDEQVAEALAVAVEIDLTDAHWEIIWFIRNYYKQYNHLPNTRLFTKAVRKKLGDLKGNTRYLYTLFPNGPLKVSCLIAGLPRPTSCI